jgi:hypothetical protein
MGGGPVPGSGGLVRVRVRKGGVAGRGGGRAGGTAATGGAEDEAAAAVSVRRKMKFKWTFMGWNFLREGR